MKLDNTPDLPSNCTTISFSDDEVQDALIEYAAQHHHLEFNLSKDDRVILCFYRIRDSYEDNFTEIHINREGSLCPPVRELTKKERKIEHKK